MKTLVFLLSMNSLSFAQDSKSSSQGPHQGVLYDTGPYQVELLSRKDGQILIYLLDKNKENPTVDNSEVGVFIKSGFTESEMTCSVDSSEKAFVCRQMGRKFKSGELAVSTKRLGIRTEEFKYPYPFNKEEVLTESSKSKKVKKKK